MSIFPLIPLTIIVKMSVRREWLTPLNVSISTIFFLATFAVFVSSRRTTSVGISIKELGGSDSLSSPFSPLPSLPLPSLLSPIPLSPFPRREAAPLNPAIGGLGSAVSSSSEVRGGAPAANAFWGYFEPRRRYFENNFGSCC